MPRFDREKASEIMRLANALATLRRSRGLSQADAGDAIGMTSQAWGLYEAGRRPGLFRPDVQDRMTGALGLSREDLLLTAARQGPGPVGRGPGVESPARPFVGAEDAEARRLQLDDDRLAPWALSGVIVEYVPGRWPRRDQGCVVETEDGETWVRLYDGGDAEAVWLRGATGLDAVERLPRARLRGLHAVVARIEP
jgi:transcriptional regulator with XRE-family HTH domain